jgi:hypothetical protein
VIFTTVSVPPTFKFPDKLILPPVIIPADSNVDETVPNEPIAEYKVLVDIFVETAFVTVIFVALSIPEDILVVANNVPVVSPVVNIALPELKVVYTAFVTVVFVAFNTPELTLVVANNVAVVTPVVNIALPELKVVVVIPVVNIALPELKVVCTAFVTVLLIAFNTPEDILVVANNVAVVRPVVNIAFPELKVV